MKTLIKNIKFDYQLYVESCMYEGTSPTYIRYTGDLVRYYAEYLLMMILAVYCKMREHDYEIFDTGDAENGPRIHGECRRCNHITGVSYHS